MRARPVFENNVDMGMVDAFQFMSQKVVPTQ